MNRKEIDKALAPFCAPDSDTPSLRRPFSVGKWAVATNRAVMVAVKGGGKLYGPNPNEWNQELSSEIIKQAKAARKDCSISLWPPGIWRCECCEESPLIFDPVQIGDAWFGGHMIEVINGLGEVKFAPADGEHSATAFTFSGESLSGIGMVMPFYIPVSRTQGGCFRQLDQAP